MTRGCALVVRHQLFAIRAGLAGRMRRAVEMPISLTMILTLARSCLAERDGRREPDGNGGYK
jgi:hypothetical protein